jgi:hypothetical protein
METCVGRDIKTALIAPINRQAHTKKATRSNRGVAMVYVCSFARFMLTLCAWTAIRLGFGRQRHICGPRIAPADILHEHGERNGIGDSTDDSDVRCAASSQWRAGKTAVISL